MIKEKIIEAKNISYSVGKNKILSGVDIDLSRGDIVTLIGPNGSGKTTLIRIILGIIKPSSGSLKISSKIKIGYMPQKIYIDRNLPITVKSFLQLEIKNSISIELISSIAKKVGIARILNSPIQEISGGEMQRVLLGKALLAEPDLLVLDEPVQGVDVTGQVEFYNLIEDIKKERGISILMVSHDLYMVMKATDHVYCLNNHICCEGTASAVSQNEAYQKLFGKKAIDTLAIYSHDHDHTHR